MGRPEATVLDVGRESVNLRAADRAAIALAEAVGRVRARHLQRTEQEAREAFAQRWGTE
jgi:hypothetical protein